MVSKFKSKAQLGIVTKDEREDLDEVWLSKRLHSASCNLLCQYVMVKCECALRFLHL